jgi:hypothetical protein
MTSVDFPVRVLLSYYTDIAFPSAKYQPYDAQSRCEQVWEEAPDGRE